MGQRLATEVGCADDVIGSVVSAPEPGVNFTIEAELLVSSIGIEVRALRICATWRGWPSFSCRACCRSFSTLCACRDDWE